MPPRLLRARENRWHHARRRLQRLSRLLFRLMDYERRKYINSVHEKNPKDGLFMDFFGIEETSGLSA